LPSRLAENVPACWWLVRIGYFCPFLWCLGLLLSVDTLINRLLFEVESLGFCPSGCGDNFLNELLYFKLYFWWNTTHNSSWKEKCLKFCTVENLSVTCCVIFFDHSITLFAFLSIAPQFGSYMCLKSLFLSDVFKCN
jgi:hypothetical protein